MVSGIFVKIRALWRRGGGDAKNGEPFLAIRVRNRDPSSNDTLPMIFSYFEENRGQTMCLQNGPLLLANSGWELPKFWVKIRASGGGARMMPKWGTLLRD